MEQAEKIGTGSTEDPIYRGSGVPVPVFSKRLISWANLVMTLFLTAFSIYGAFIGADKAQAFFNSIPLSVYWLIFTALFIAAISVLPRLLQIRGLFLVHVGCVLILAGAMLGSRAGMKIGDKLFKTDTLRSGQMAIYEKQTAKAVLTEDAVQKELPFDVKLVDFRLEYYDPGQITIQTRQGESFKIPAKPGLKYLLNANLGSVEVVKTFKRLRMISANGKMTAIEDPNGGSNPAVELLLISPEGKITTKYVFERFSGHPAPNENLIFSYRRTISDFISDLEVVKDGKVLAKKSIEVNKPLHFGGYIFYQQSYDNIGGRFSVLRVTTDRGIGIVYLGYILLCAGVFWHLWFRHIFGDRLIED